MVLQKKRISADNALMRLENLCARSEHCGWELREKLRGWGISGSDAEKILDSLHRARYYDDERFARAFARDKLLYNRWGRRKISMAMKAKRIDNDVIDEAVDELDTYEYYAVLSGFMKARAKSIKEGDTYEGRTKLFRAALSRGFESQLISRVIQAGGLWPDNDD